MKHHRTPRPLPVAHEGNRFARRAWWRGFELTPGVTLKTTAHLRPALADASPWRRLAAIAWAASAALALHPRLNFFTFWGRPAWAGWPVRVAVVLENGDASCDMVVLEAAHHLELDALEELLRARQGALGLPGLRGRMRETMPVASYWAERLTGAFAQDYARRNAPLFISMVGLKGIEEASFTPAHSMALYPGSLDRGRLPLVLCFNHQLANARPVGRLLVCLKELLE
ncbi:MAG: hypothetical protein KMY53_14250 [Desulfarculus sp.]|nr:hypothetical protein [Pseudomonadota bacterium]MBV1716649.1 hypothetical protein [Desulfarculus sp.]MBU4575516.1 hypothetical protein [Pseudomonadota bacterium]MBU4597048.1 hypothetical protein [Pseudomonadota bacterium]MBV1739325.1 hypothetical protein [Desulfarculus sp.]